MTVINVKSKLSFNISDTIKACGPDIPDIVQQAFVNRLPLLSKVMSDFGLIIKMEFYYISKKYYPIYIETYYIKWTTTFWTCSRKRIFQRQILFHIYGSPKVGLIKLCGVTRRSLNPDLSRIPGPEFSKGVQTSQRTQLTSECNNRCTVCPRSSYPFYILTYYIKWDTTSWN